MKGTAETATDWVAHSSWSLVPREVTVDERAMAYRCAILMLALFAAGCNQTGAPPADSGWQGALGRLSGQSDAIYSFRFTSAGSDGIHGQIAIHETSVADACSRYDGAADANLDYWFIDLELGDIVQGTYALTTANALDARSTAANVSLLHRKNGEYTENYPALGGTVTLDNALSIAGAGSGMPITLEVHAEFGAHPVQQVGCSGGQARDSSVIDSYCSCRDLEGVMTTCVPVSGVDYCCAVADGGVVAFDFRLAAQPCAAMCRTAVGLPDLCASVAP